MKANKSAVVILIPVLETKLFGWPGMLRLTRKEADAMRLYHLGGPGAWRTATAKVACRTIDSLTVKGLLDRNGATDLGKYVAESCAEFIHRETVGEISMVD